MCRSKTEGEFAVFQPHKTFGTADLDEAEVNTENNARKQWEKRHLPSHVTSIIESTAAVKLDCAKGPHGRARAPAAAIDGRKKS